jgi:hypothetical protein
VRDLIADPASPIGRQLLPLKIGHVREPELLTLDVTYSAHRRVPPDWISLVSGVLDARVNVLGAIVEELGDQTAGRLVISLGFNERAHSDPDSVIRYLGGLGIIATLRNRTHDAKTLLGVA